MCATTTRNIAYRAIQDQEVRRLASVDFTTKDFHEFEKDILKAAKAVPSILGGGKHGHAWLVKSTAGYQKLTGDNTIVQAFIDHPGTVADIQTADSHAVIALKTAKKAESLTSYYTQCGSADGLRDLIIKRVPKSTIEDLEDEEEGWTGITALELLDHLRDQAEVVDVVDVNALLAERDEPMDFEGTTSLKVFFKDKERIIKTLKDDHKITSSHSELIIRYLLQIGKVDGDIMRAAVDSWHQHSTANKTWTKFKSHFSAADKKRCDAIKAREPFKSADLANNAAEGTPVTQEDLGAMFAAAFETFATGAEDSINAAINSKFDAFKASSSTSASKTKEDELRKQIDTLQRKLAAQAKNEDGNSSEEPAWKKNPCKYCGKHHPTHEERCWKKKENRSRAPQRWRDANPE